MRIYDPRVGRFFSMDPISENYPELTPFQFASNNPIESIDIDGLEKGKPQGQENPFTYFERVMDNLQAGLEKKYHNLEAAALRADAKNEGFKSLNKVVVRIMKNPFQADRNLSENVRKQANEAVNDGLTYFNLTASGQNEKGSVFLGKKLAVYGPMLFMPEEGEAVDFTEGIAANGEIKTLAESSTNITALRRSAVSSAWKEERELVLETGQGTRRWTKAEITELKTSGKVKGYHGHHINSVNGSPELAGDPNNIEFVKGVKENLQRHGGNFRNQTQGSLINRKKTLQNFKN
jgi:hypothetical protein